VVKGLGVAGVLRPGDRFHLWEFDTTANPVQSRQGDTLLGGTAAETSSATVLERPSLPAAGSWSTMDGQTHGLDVRAAAGSDRILLTGCSGRSRPRRGTARPKLMMNSFD
jgi:hypothetical protein